MKKILLALLVLAVAGGGVGYYLYEKPVADAGASATELTVGATELFAAYEADEAAANDRFLSKNLAVSGEVADVSTTESGVTTVSLVAGGLLGGVACELAPGQSAEGLSPGQQTTIKGFCSGLLMDVVLSRCVIVKQ